jgi:hypothetical protein
LKKEGWKGFKMVKISEILNPPLTPLFQSGECPLSLWERVKGEGFFKNSN